MCADRNAESSDSTANSDRWWTPRLVGPLIAAAVVRLTLLALSLARTGTNGIIIDDTSSYLIPGRNLLLHGAFFADGVPDLVRTPGYPLFLAVTSLAGLWAAAAANGILSVFSVILVWRLGRAIFGDNWIALGAAWLFAFEPVSIALSVMLLSESLFLVFFLLSMERLVEFLRKRRLRALAAAGVWLAATTIVRPVTYYLPVALALGLFLVLARVPQLRWKAPAVLLISVLPWLAAWQIRNWMETGYGGFSSLSEINLYFDDAADVTARMEHRPFLEVRKEMGYLDFTGRSGQVYLYPTYLALHPEQTGWGQGQRLAFMHSEAERLMRAHYGIFLRSCMQPILTMVFNPGAGFFDHLLSRDGSNLLSGIISNGPFRWGLYLAKTHPALAAEKAALIIVLLVFYLFAARGVLRCNMRDPCLWLLLGTSLYFVAVSAAAAGIAADARLRLPVMPVVCILAAAGLRRTTASIGERGALPE
jgi:hypothetical protein